MPMNTRATLALAAALTLAASPFGTAALGHSKSEKTVPADGATVASVETVRMTFDKPMRITSFRLIAGEEEQPVKRGVGMEPVTKFSATPGRPLEPGTYRVDWRGLSDDGHPMNGSWSFTVAR